MYKVLFVLCSLLIIPHAYAGVASSDYVTSAVSVHTSDVSNPHSVTAAQVGLGDVKNIDTTNAENITSGTLNTERLAVGTTTGTVAAGDDARFYGIPTAKPAVTVPGDMALVWFE